jgi:hypothetical protein
MNTLKVNIFKKKIIQAQISLRHFGLLWSGFGRKSCGRNKSKNGKNITICLFYHFAGIQPS